MLRLLVIHISFSCLGDESTASHASHVVHSASSGRAHRDVTTVGLCGSCEMWIAHICGSLRVRSPEGHLLGGVLGLRSRGSLLELLRCAGRGRVLVSRYGVRRWIGSVMLLRLWKMHLRGRLGRVARRNVLGVGCVGGIDGRVHSMLDNMPILVVLILWRGGLGSGNVTGLEGFGRLLYLRERTIDRWIFELLENNGGGTMCGY